MPRKARINIIKGRREHKKGKLVGGPQNLKVLRISQRRRAEKLTIPKKEKFSETSGNQT